MEKNIMFSRRVEKNKLFKIHSLDYVNSNFKENSGSYVTFRPEFSNGQFGKTGNTIAQIVHNYIIEPYNRIIKGGSYY